MTTRCKQAQSSKCLCVYGLYLSMSVFMSHCFHRLSLEKTLVGSWLCPSLRKEDHCNYAHHLRSVPIWVCGKGQAVWLWGLWGNPDLMLWEESFWVQQCLATWQGSCKPFSVTFRNKTVDIPCHSQSSSFSWLCRSSVSCLAALGHGKMCVYVPSLALVRHDTTSAFISCSPVSTKSHLQQFRHFFSRLWYICTSH